MVAVTVSTMTPGRPRAALGPSRRRNPGPRRVAMLSLHTSPLAQPGEGDAGGMNVYVLQLARQLAARDVAVEVFTRSTSGDLPPVVEAAPGVLVRHVAAGPYEGLRRDELPGQLCSFTAGVLRAEAFATPGYYDLVHSHYWLSGQVGWVASERWDVPLVHSAHTLAKVKNASLAEGDTPEPRVRVLGEEQVVAAADRLVAATVDEARQLRQLYDAQPGQVDVIAPGVDLEMFRLGDASASRNHLGIPPDALVLAFVGRVQKLKAPDVLLRAAACLLSSDPDLRARLVVLVVGGASGVGGSESVAELHRLACELGVDDVVRYLPAMPPAELVHVYRAATAVVVPSHNETFGLVAVEAQACGTPVVATRVGGLRTAVAPTGVLVDGHDPRAWAASLRPILMSERHRATLATAAHAHALGFGWDVTAAATLETYTSALMSTERRLEVVS